MRFLLIAALLLVSSCVKSNYYEHDQWAKPNFKKSPEPAAVAPTPDILTPQNEVAAPN